MMQPVKEGEEYQVTIESVGAKGDGVAKIGGMVVFIQGALQDHVYDVKITRVKEKFSFAEIVQEVR